ncbi:prenyltransferase and squalene oxidase repeat-containing domain protein [Oesophagostomum dentatum]|uniref:Prenyltransferase and squalene oxidase repeat-containing domain protein n=1 Tax=Oesophagostomum dentatum TaxID=61180 RepID=A0A0B1TMN0_OESDE|nr:prenyltransferase and squalene oxidase repeat-containing domain protein [Oesophagostomum dentatum]
MSALYCEPKLRDFGLANHGWRGFGGVLSDLKGGEIPQYNLVAFWKRPVAPVVTGFVEHVIRGEAVKVAGRRPPGSLRADLDEKAFSNVNSLAATSQDSGEVTIWTVSAEASGYSVLEHAAEFQDGILSSEGRLQSKIGFNEPVLELRPSEMKRSQFWTRCRGHLILVEPCEDVKECVFRSSVRSFEECKTLPGDVALCDMNGMVWSGTVGASLSRTKTLGSDFKLVTYTDHPRVVLVSSLHEVKNLDLRVSTSKTDILFEVPELSKKESVDKAVYVPEEALERPFISQLKTLISHPHNFFVLTAHSAYLCDDRFPKNTVLSLPHSIPYGAHVLQVADPVPDPEGSGEVISVYLLDHLLTGVWVSRLYWHNCNAWSSILPIHMMSDGLDFQRLMKPRLTGASPKSHPDPLNGIAVVQGFKDQARRDVDLLLRSSSDGNVYYQTMRYGCIDDTELKALWTESRERVESSWDSLNSSDIFVPSSSESTQSSLVSIEFDIEGVVIKKKGFKDQARRDVDLLLRSSSDGNVYYQTMRYGCIDDAEFKTLWVESRERMESAWDSLNSSDIFVPPSSESTQSSLVSIEFDIEGVMMKKKVWNPLKKKVNKKCSTLDVLETTNPQAVLPGVINDVWKEAMGLAKIDGLLCLAILGDNFERVNRIAILSSLRESQKEDGSFWSEGKGSESDMRFVFCAVAICHILQDYSYINWTSLGSFIKASLNYDGGIGQGPGDESHGGSTFCAIASLSLSNRLWDESVLTRKQINRLVKWALWKHDHGFHGRAHKDDDSCYAFWIGATLEIMILLPPADLGQEEAIFWILTHLKTFQQNADCLFSRVTSRLEEMNSTYQQLQSRLETVNRKVGALRRMNTTGVLTCLSTFPESSYTPAGDLLVPTVTNVQKPIFAPKTRTALAVDMRRELEDRKRFYLPNQLTHQASTSVQEKQAQRRVASFADMFYAGTDELAFGEKAINTISNGKRLRTKDESRDDGSEIDVPVIGGEQSKTVDPLDYIPEIGPIEELDLPSILPDLPGIAEDVTLPDFDIVLPSFPELPHIVSEPKILKEPESLGERSASVPNFPKLSEEKSKSTAPEKPSDNVSSIPQNNDRADLMAAIRAAGGAGKAKLKSVSAKRRAKESESLGSSALSEKNSSPGNDLMTSLAKALEARRKAISGMGPSTAGVDGVSKGIEGTSADDEWK